jgi:hypothetical protein
VKFINTYNYYALIIIVMKKDKHLQEKKKKETVQNMGIFNHPGSLNHVNISLHLALVKSRQIWDLQ